MSVLLAGFFSLALVMFAQSAGAQNGAFDVAQNGKVIGSARYEFTAAKDGYDSTSQVKVAMEGLDYALSKNEQLSSSKELEHAILSATVNGQAVNVVVAPDAVQFLVTISANGKSTTTKLDAHPAAVLLPDFDAGALETLLALAAAHNNRDLWVILPKEAGSIEPVRLATYPDEDGVLEGKPVAVHHLVAMIAGENTDLYSGPENQLLQAELPEGGFALIRKGFELKPPARPVVPIGPESTPQAPAN